MSSRPLRTRKASKISNKKMYSELQTVVDKGRKRGTDTLVVCCTEAADLLSTDTGKDRTAVPALVYSRLEFTSYEKINMKCKLR
ncbi:hypothetical protein Y032_0103g3570 [Ancylostoma ceylanicum]|uniref:Uncharacterized protein n=1 Tax=Ancylostoma ceylanicum TaxID=53326 RepID=A0A016TH43_9BILA|nr:hypothetical protein Y032_0103g3570 [Ancylostoma ceylanicum]